MKTISLLHPFTAQAIGLKEEDLYFFHSKPHELALAVLQKEGHQVFIDYFTGRWFPYTKEVNGLVKKFWPVGFNWFKNRHQWRRQRSCWHHNHVRFHLPDVTIINMSGHGSPYVFEHAALLRKKGKAYIAMIGGMNLSVTDTALHYYRGAAHIVVHTYYQKTKLWEISGFESLDIRVIPLGIDTKIFCPKDESNDTTIQLLFVGRISRLKQIELAIESVELLKKQTGKKVVLKIIGPESDSGYLKELKQLVSELEVTDSVKFMGALGQEGLIPHYQKAQLLLLPSAHESFGMVMVEAMACGTPTVALKGAGGPDEIVEDGRTGILCSKADYSVKVKELAINENLLKTYSENSRNSVLQKWSMEQTIAGFRNSVESVFSHGS